MAIIPTFQRQKNFPASTGVKAPPVVQIQNFVGEALGNFGSALAQTGETLFKAEVTSQVNTATANAQIKLEALKRELDAGDAATAIGTYDARAEQIRSEAATGLAGVALEEFDQRYTTLSTKGRIHNEATVTKKRFNELKGGLVTSLDGLAKVAATDPTAVTTAMASIDTAKNTGVIDALEAAKLKLSFKSKADTTRATLALTADPGQFKKDLTAVDKNGNPTYLPDLDAVQRAKFLERAETRITRNKNRDETARKKEERKYLTGADQYAKAVEAGSQVDPVIASLYTDDQIRAAIKDPVEAEKVIAQIRDAEEFGAIKEKVVGASVEDQNAALAQVDADADAVAKTPAEVAVAAENQRQAKILKQAIQQDRAERLRDSGAYVVLHDDAVKEAFKGVQESLTNPQGVDPMVAKQHWENYKHARDAAYDRMGFAHQTRMPLPKNVAKALVENIQGSFGQDPEVVAKSFQNQVAGFGDDYNRVIAQLVDEGLEPNAAALAYNDNPITTQKLVAIMRDDGIKVLEAAVGTTNKSDITKALLTEFAALNQVAGTGNARFVAPITSAAKIIAMDNMRRGEADPTTAAKNAVNEVLHSQFQIVNLPGLKGIVPKAAGAYDPQAVQVGADMYMKTDFLDVQLDLRQFDPKVFAGITDIHKAQEMGNKLVRANSHWAFTPDGSKLVVMDAGAGVPIRDNQGNQILIDARGSEILGQGGTDVEVGN